MRDITTEANKMLVREMLENWHSYNWSLQGFGMLRRYFSEDHIYRLHIWDSSYSVANVSNIHTHPWSFESLVVAGRVHNRRYKVMEGLDPNYMRQRILTGEGGGPVADPEPVCLKVAIEEAVEEGQTYYQDASEMHSSHPEDGTVTIIKRTFGSDVDHADSFFPYGEEWVSAEPGPAVGPTISDIIQNSLEKWF